MWGVTQTRLQQRNLGRFLAARRLQRLFERPPLLLGVGDLARETIPPGLQILQVGLGTATGLIRRLAGGGGVMVYGGPRG